MTPSRVLVILALVVALLMAVFFRCADAMEEFDRYLYTLKSGDQITVAWDPQTAATYYELRLYHFEWAQEVGLPVAIGRTSADQITFVLAKSGHYEIWVRACCEACGENDEEVCSDYSKSINAAVASVKGEARAWWVYTYIAPPPDGGIGGIE